MNDPVGPKKETVRITLPPRVRPGESRETVRINMPPKPVATGSPAQSPPRPPPPGSPLRAAAGLPPLPAPPPPLVSAAAPVRPPVLTRSPPPPPPPVAPPVSAVIVAESAAPLPETPTIPAAPPPMPPRPRVLPPPPRVPPSIVPGPGSVAPAIYPGSASHGPKKETARISILPQPVARPSPTVKMTKTQPLLTVPQANIHSAPVTMAAPTAPAFAAKSFDAIPLPICWTIFGISAVTLLIQIWNYFAS